jgi:hypothetical protein
MHARILNCNNTDFFADYYAVMPPYDMFISLDKPSRVKHFFQVNICSISVHEEEVE